MRRASVRRYGFSTLTSRRNPANTISIFYQRETQGITDRGPWYATSGTGKFAHVRGSGYWEQEYYGNTYAEDLNGTITY